jgi:hypothetical protein
MQKVKVHRYVSGKRPDYAPMSSSEEESEEDDFIEQKRRHLASRPMSPAETREQDVEAAGEVDMDDPRLRRLKTRKKDDREEESDDENRMERHRLDLFSYRIKICCGHFLNFYAGYYYFSCVKMFSGHENETRAACILILIS